MAVTRQKKEEVLQELVDKFAKSKSVVFADYRGLDVASISGLRKSLREQDAEMKVAKKTLIGLAAKESNIGDIDKSVMEGPVLATFSYEDAVAGIKVLFKFSKENENLKLLGGVIDGKVVGPAVIQEYAKLPGREELLAKLLGSMSSPLSGFVGIGNSLISGFVRVLDAIKDKKPEEAAPEAPKEEAKTDEAPAASAEEEKAKEAPDETPEAPAEEATADTAEAPVEEEKADTPAEEAPEKKEEEAA
jgi:large subunit ribosomal protein L10